MSNEITQLTYGKHNWRVQVHECYYDVYIIWQGDFKFAYYWADSKQSRFIREQYSSAELEAYLDFLNYLDKWHGKRIASAGCDCWSTEIVGAQLTVQKGDFLAVDESPQGATEPDVKLYYSKRRIGSYDPRTRKLDLGGLDGIALTMPIWADFATFCDFLRTSRWKGGEA